MINVQQRLGKCYSDLRYVAKRIANAQGRGVPPRQEDLDELAFIRQRIADIRAGRFAPVESVLINPTPAEVHAEKRSADL